MEQVFTWTGFICLMLIVLSMTFFAVVYLVDMAFRKTKLINRVFKVMSNFYETLPKVRVDQGKYVLTLYDWKNQRFIDSTFLNEFGEDNEEYKRYWDEMRRKHAFKRREDQHD